LTIAIEIYKKFNILLKNKNILNISFITFSVINIIFVCFIKNKMHIIIQYTYLLIATVELL